MRGIILAGGTGSRLYPLTKISNKHLLPVYDRPMIEYPLSTLIDIGCDEIMIVTGGEHVGNFAEYLGDGSRYNVDICYKVQMDSSGIPDALMCGKGFVNDLFPVILGDNYFEVSYRLHKPGILVKEVDDPSRFGVWNEKMNSIVEKPLSTQSGYAVTGLYWYETEVFDWIEKLVPSPRGELEITDINNLLLKNDGIVIRYSDMWSDMGTFDSIQEVSNKISLEKTLTSYNHVVI